LEKDLADLSKRIGEYFLATEENVQQLLASRNVEEASIALKTQDQPLVQHAGLISYIIGQGEVRVVDKNLSSLKGCTEARVVNGEAVF
jgi:hypothetical protein